MSQMAFRSPRPHMDTCDPRNHIDTYIQHQHQSPRRWPQTHINRHTIKSLYSYIRRTDYVDAGHKMPRHTEMHIAYHMHAHTQYRSSQTLGSQITGFQETVTPTPANTKNPIRTIYTHTEKHTMITKSQETHQHLYNHKERI